MAIIRFSITHRTRSVGSHPPQEVVQYLRREGKYAPGKNRDVGYLTRDTPATQTRDDLRHVELGNMPEWARGDAATFFQAAYTHERVNGRYATAMQIALPRELSHDQHLALTRDFVQAHLHDKPSLWVKHEPTAWDGQWQPHIHVLLSERTIDGIARSPEQFFRRANREYPERGGAQKDPFWNERRAPGRLRESWASLTNYHLERAGLDARIDPRRLAVQGIEREPGTKWHKSLHQRDTTHEYAVASRWWESQKQALGIENVHSIARDDMMQRVRDRAHRGRPGRALPRPSLEQLQHRAQALTTTAQRLTIHANRVHAEVMQERHYVRTGQTRSAVSQVRVHQLLAQGNALGLDDTPRPALRARVRSREREQEQELEEDLGLELGW